jgi:hypothetical protein
MLTTRLRRSLVVVPAVTMLLAGCSGGGSAAPSSDGSGDSAAGGSGTASESTSPSPTPTNYLDVGKKVTLTEQGTGLELGRTATVAWVLDKKKNAVVDLKVTKVEQVPISQLSAWVLDKKSKSSTPYFVHARVTNVGRSDLSGQTVPLYLAVGKNTLVSASSFASQFKPCPSTPLPKKSKPGTKATTCWVYLAPDHGKMQNVSFFTGPGFVPITWSGKPVVVKDKKDTKKKKSDGKKNNQG